MNEIVIFEDSGLLNPEISNKIAEFEKKIKKLKKQEDLLKQSIMVEMEAKGIVKIENDDLLISYVASTNRETFDSKKLREDNPDLYDEYIKITEVKASIRVKVKR